MRKSTPQDFFGKLKPNANGCLEWTLSLFTQGYGTVTYQGKQWRTHRLAWTLTNGEIPNGLMVCHKCDNKKCCNPTHLFLGTASDNMGDWKDKGLSRKGAQINVSKLNDVSVIRLRKSFQQGSSYEQLAKEFGVNKPTCYKIVKGWTWTHLPLYPRPEWVNDKPFRPPIQVLDKADDSTTQAAQT